MKQTAIKHINTLWLVLIILTLLSAFIAEKGGTNLSSISIMALVLAIKGRIIVDHFMELKHANRILRRLMQAYFYVIPLLILLVYFFPQQIANWTHL